MVQALPAVAPSQLLRGSSTGATDTDKAAYRNTDWEARAACLIGPPARSRRADYFSRLRLLKVSSLMDSLTFHCLRVSFVDRPFV